MAIGFLFGGDTNETPESIRRKRQIAQALLGSSGAPRNVGEGLNALGDGIVSAVLNSRADKAEKSGQDSAASDFAPLLGGFGGGSSSMPTPGAAGEMGATSPKYDRAPVTANGEVADYIRQSAAARGIDPDIALRVAMSEGGVEDPVRQSLVVKNGVREPSYGPFQLYMGGGLGNKALAAGIDPRDPNQWKKGVDFALDEAKSGGWSPWYGARKLGITGKMGIGTAPQQPAEVASLDPSAGMAATAPIQPPPVNQSPAAPQAGYIDPQVTTDGQQAPVAPTQVQQPSPAVVQALTAPQKGGRLGTPPQPLSDADFNSRFGADDTGAIPPQAGPQSALAPLPVTEVGPTPTVAGVAPVADTGQAQTQVAQALLKGDRSGVGIGGDAPGAGYFPAAPNAQGQGPSQQQILKVLTNPFASDAQKAVANALLKRSMDENDPDTALDRKLKQSQIDALNTKQSGYAVLTPAERKSLGIPDNDQRVYQRGPNGQIDAVGGAGQTINVGNEVEARRQAAAQAGLKPENPAYQGFILTGKLPKESEQSLTSTDKKAILEADDAVSTNKSAIGLLDQAMAINDKANSGWFAGTRAMLGNNLPDAVVPDWASSPESSAATTEYDNLVQQGALSQLKTIFGGNPTEGERSILLDLQASSNKPPAIRAKILQRAKSLAEARLTLNQQRADQLRGGDFYKPQGGTSGGQTAPSVDDLLKKYGTPQ